MDWLFYLIVGVVLFVILAGALVARYLLMVRLEEAQRKFDQEEDERDTAEANSGL